MYITCPIYMYIFFYQEIHKLQEDASAQQSVLIYVYIFFYIFIFIRRCTSCRKMRQRFRFKSKPKLNVYQEMHELQDDASAQAVVVVWKDSLIARYRQVCICRGLGSRV